MMTHITLAAEVEKEVVFDKTFEHIVMTYQKLIYGIALSGTGNAHDANDVFQETFLAYHRTNKQFRSEEHIKAWLIRTARNQCKRVTGSAWKKRTVSLEEVNELSYSFSIKEENEFFTAFQAVPVSYRTVLYLHYFAGYNSDEIGKMLKIRSGTIRMQLTRGRKILKEKLERSNKNE